MPSPLTDFHSPRLLRFRHSGGALKALAATHTLARLIQRAREISKLRDTKLSILPGSGLNAATLPAFLNDLQAAPHKLRPEEVHCSCGKWVDYMTDGDVDVGPERIQLQADVDAKRGVFGFGFGAFGPVGKCCGRNSICSVFIANTGGKTGLCFVQ